MKKGLQAQALFLFACRCLPRVAGWRLDARSFGSPARKMTGGDVLVCHEGAGLHPRWDALVTGLSAQAK